MTTTSTREHDRAEFWTAKGLHLTAAHCTGLSHLGEPDHFDVKAYFMTEGERDEFLARFPKSAGLKPSTLSGVGGFKVFSVSGGARLLSDGVNGGRNETGVKRLGTILKAAAKLGLEVGYEAPYGNSYPSMAEFLAALD